MNTALVVAIVLSALCVLVGALTFIRWRSWRGLVRGIGWGIIVMASFFFGLMNLLVAGAIAVYEWIVSTVWTQLMTNSLIAAGIGLVLLVVAQYLPAGKKSDDAAAQPGQPAATGPGQTAALPASPPRGGKKAAIDPEDAEIEALLKSRGIE